MLKKIYNLFCGIDFSLYLCIGFETEPATKLETKFKKTSKNKKKNEDIERT